MLPKASDANTGWTLPDRAVMVGNAVMARTVDTRVCGQECKTGRTQ